MTDMTAFDRLGKLAWLWMNSPLHASWATRIMMRNLIPPISIGQYKMLEKGDFPVAYASWAFFSEDAERRYILHPSRIELEDWTSGDRMWLIDFISPFSTRYTIKLKNGLRESFPDRYARALRVHPGGTVARVSTYTGGHVSEGWRARADAQVLSQFARQHSPIDE